MAIRKILTIPDPILRNKSLPVDKVNKEIKRIKNDSIIKLKRQPNSKGFVL